MRKEGRNAHRSLIHSSGSEVPEPRWQWLTLPQVGAATSYWSSQNGLTATPIWVIPLVGTEHHLWCGSGLHSGECQA
jgi:hypothetical protein